MEYPDSRHVTELALDTATDADVWKYAGDHGYVIASKDSDFRQLAFLHGPPPKAIWLRVGNATTNDIHQLLADAYDTFAAFADDADDADEALLVLGPE